MAEPIIPPQIQPKAAAPDVDVPSVSSGPREQGKVVDVSDYLKPSESMPRISSELKSYIQAPEEQVPQNEILKVSGESAPVVTSPTGKVQLPEVPKRQKAELDLKSGPREGKAWKGLEIIREEDRVQMAVLRARIKELQKAEKAA